MPLYEISPPHNRSYTSPFDEYGLEDYGLGDDVAIAAAVTPAAVDAVMAAPATKVDEGIDWMAYLSPIIAGGIMAMFSYGVVRKFDVNKDKALGIAVTIGGLTALGHGLSSWLFKHTEPIRKQLPTNVAAVVDAVTKK